MAIPFIAILQVVTALGAAFLVLSNRMDESSSKSAEIRAEVREQITRLKALGAAVEDETRTMLEGYEEKSKVHRERIRELEAEKKKQDEIIKSSTNNFQSNSSFMDSGGSSGRNEAIRETRRLNDQIAELTNTIEASDKAVEELSEGLAKLASEMGPARFNVGEFEQRFQDLSDSFINGNKEMREFSDSMDIFKSLQNQINEALENGANSSIVNRAALIELQQAMANSNPLTEFSREIEDIISANERMALSTAEAFQFGEEGAFRLNDSYNEAKASVEGFNNAQIEQAAITLGTANSITAVTDALAQLLEKQKTIGEAESVFNFMQDFDPANFTDTRMSDIQKQFDQFREILIANLGEEEGIYAEHFAALARMQSEAAGARTGQLAEEALQNVSQGGANIASALGTALGEQHSVYQRFAQAQAMINAALAISQVLKDDTIPSTWGKIAMAGTIGAMAGAQVGAIQAQSFATGGLVRGEGGPTADKIPAMLSNREFVINAAAVRNFGASNLERINRGQLPALSMGGMIGGMSSSRNSGGGTSVEINDYRSQGEQVSVEQVTEPNGNTKIRLMVRDAVRETMNRGGLDRDMEINFGQQRRGKFR